MTRNKKYQKLLLAAALVVIAVLFSLLFGLTYGNRSKVKIGFIMSGSRADEGWNGEHYQGIMKAGEEAGVRVLVEENVTEFSGQCEDAVKKLAKKECGLLILSSYNYSEEIYQMAEEYPEISFYVNSSEYHAVNMTSYFVKMYQARYLAGIVAGMMTKTNQIGYVAAMSNNEVNRGISAFALGVRRVNPEAEVTVMFTGSWEDETAETAAAEALIEEVGADVLTYHQNKSYVIEVAEQKGIYSIGYQSGQKFSEKNLTAVCCDWSLIYKELVQAYLKGRANATDNFWIGLETGAVGLAELSDCVSQEAAAEVEKATQEILSGKAIFSGVIYDTEGRQRCGEDELISDESLLEHFDWLVEGVTLYEK